MRTRDTTASSAIIPLVAGTTTFSAVLVFLSLPDLIVKHIDSVAGSYFTAKVNFGDCEGCSHAGDCFFYLSYDAAWQSPQNWFKIAQIPGCAQMKAGQFNVEAGYTPPQVKSL
jgi:hypothetical protein